MASKYIYLTEEESEHLISMSQPPNIYCVEFGPGFNRYDPDDPDTKWMSRELHRLRFPERYCPECLI